VNTQHYYGAARVNLRRHHSQQAYYITHNIHQKNKLTTDKTTSMKEEDIKKKIRGIKHLEFQKVLAHCLNREAPFVAAHYEFISKHEGGFNHVRLYKCHLGTHAGTYAVKVPFIGVQGCWTGQDAHLLRCEFGLLREIFEKTQCPVPEAIAYDDTVDNGMGAPYLVMRAVSGVPADKIWFEKNQNPNHPSEDRMKMRVCFLQSLARSMASLRSLRFEKIGKPQMVLQGRGMVRYDIEDTWIRTTIDPKKNGFWCLQHFETSYEYFARGLEKSWPVVKNEGPFETGIRLVLRTLIESMSFLSSASAQKGKEPFFLRHTDLNWQNILCDPNTGAVTAIIDWGDATTAPACVGAFAVPHFLMDDWLPGYSLGTQPHSPWELQKYREVYATAMIRNVGRGSGGQYTLNSALYQALDGALYGGFCRGSHKDFVRKVLRQLPSLASVDIDDFLTLIGKGYHDGLKFLAQELPKLVEPLSLEQQKNALVNKTISK
jgi:hypothetical protein